MLLPYTGSQAAIGASLERGAIMAVERANQSGGILGKPIRLVFADTHSDARRAVSSVQDLLDQGALAILGPESAEVAAAILPKLTERRVPLLTPFLGDAVELRGDANPLWFRLAPSARALGEAIAKKLFRDGRTSAAFVYTTDRYGLDLATAAQERYVTLGGSVTVAQPLSVGKSGYSEEVRSLSQDSDALVLLADPLPGARLVNELYVSFPSTAWRFYLSPNLKTGVFLQNVIGSVLNGAVGVAPELGQDVTPFTDAYRTQFLGDEPVEGTFFYYDATALVLLALQRAAHTHGSADVGGDALVRAVRAVANQNGISAGWDELDSAMQRLGRGEQVYYSGLTGPILLDPAGSRALGTTEVWSILNGQISGGETNAP